MLHSKVMKNRTYVYGMILIVEQYEQMAHPKGGVSVAQTHIPNATERSQICKCH